MILSGKEILKNVEKGNIIIEPFDRSKVNPNSYNLTLSNELLVYEHKELDMKIPNPTKKDRKSTRLNSSHANISYAVFCLKKNIQLLVRLYLPALLHPLH